MAGVAAELLIYWRQDVTSANFGHIAKYCRNDKEICGHCTEEDHVFKKPQQKQEFAIFAIIVREAESRHHTS